MRRIIKLASLFIIATFVFWVVSFQTDKAGAAGATLSLSPSSATKTVGDSFSVSVVVNSGGGDGINASDAVVSFDKKLLVVKKVSKDSSIFNLWTTEPTFSNADGTITYSGGSPTAYKGSSGVLMNITFTALAAGDATVKFSSASVLAADGKGTNVLSATPSAKYVLKAKEETPPEPPKEETPPPTKPTVPPTEEKTTTSGLIPPPPKVKSSTHPEEGVWYSNSNPEFEWKLLADVSGVSFLLDNATSTDPGKKSDGIIELKKFENIPDGENYFHIKFQNKNGFGPITHRQVLIDSTPPKEFELSIDDGGDPTNPQPKLIFSTSDEASGIASYKATLDGEMKDITAQDWIKTPYEFPVLKPGLHKLAMAVSDRAGNVASSTKEFLIEALKAPVITEIPKMIYKGDELAIQGTSFYPDAIIKIFITKDDKNVKTVEAKTDADGNWTYFQQNDLTKGVYHIWAKVIDQRGAESNESMKKTLTVQAPSIVCAYGWWIMTGLLAVILGLIVLLFYLNHAHKRQRERAIRESRELEKRLNEIFSALKEEVNELLEMADKKPGYSETEKRAKDKINEALDISQEFISKEIKDVEKEIE